LSSAQGIARLASGLSAMRGKVPALAAYDSGHPCAHGYLQPSPLPARLTERSWTAHDFRLTWGCAWSNDEPALQAFGGACEALLRRHELWHLTPLEHDAQRRGRGSAGEAPPARRYYTQGGRLVEPAARFCTRSRWVIAGCLREEYRPAWGEVQ
jgi:hypothetical protein